MRQSPGAMNSQANGAGDKINRAAPGSSTRQDGNTGSPGSAANAVAGDAQAGGASQAGDAVAADGISDATNEDQSRTSEDLCLFVRNATIEDRASPRPDVQAALTKIGQGDACPGGVDLTGAHIQKANLPLADLRGARLVDVDLSGSNLVGAKFSGANLSGANLSGADLTGADLRGAILTDGAILNGANLTAANLSRADGKDAPGAEDDINPKAAMCRSNGSGPVTNLTGAKLVNAILMGATLDNANASDGTDFSRAHLDDTRLVGVNLGNADMTKVTVSAKTDFTGAFFSNTNLTGVDLMKTNTSATQLHGACGAPATHPAGLKTTFGRCNRPRPAASHESNARPD